MVEVGEQDGLGVGGLDVFAGAAVAMAAGTDFVVEGAVDLWWGLLVFASYICGEGSWEGFSGFAHYLVLFCAEDGGEIVRHDEVRRSEDALFR